MLCILAPLSFSDVLRVISSCSSPRENLSKIAARGWKTDCVDPVEVAGAAWTGIRGFWGVSGAAPALQMWLRKEWKI